jgi:D-arginine dehydrogenase
MAQASFDIVIIGAGIAGASVAADLARTRNVLLIEREDVAGYHSTGRSAALFSEIYGNSAVRALSRASRDFFYETPAGFSPTPLIKPRGSLYIAGPSQTVALETFAHSEGVGDAVQRLSQSETLALCPILRPEHVAAALLEKDAADVDVDALHQGFLRQFRARGGTSVLNAGVRALSRTGNEWRIDTAAGEFRAGIVVNAAGAWADHVATLAGAATLNIQPCRRTALLIELPSGIVADSWPMIIDIDEAFYLKPDAGLLLISPADETPVDACDVQPEELDAAIAIARVEDATMLTIRRVRKKWAGLRSFAPDRSPVAGFDPEVRGFFWLAGQGGYGIQTAPGLSKLAASLLRGDAIEAGSRELVAALSPKRFSLPARSFA